MKMLVSVVCFAVQLDFKKSLESIEYLTHLFANKALQVGLYFRPIHCIWYLL